MLRAAPPALLPADPRAGAGVGHARENAALFQASFLRLKAWAAGEGPRAEYRDRYNKPVPYTAEYARAWGVLSQLYKQPDQLFRAIETTGYMALNQSQHPYLRHSIDTGEETVLAAALESLRVRLPPLTSDLTSPCRGVALAGGFVPDGWLCGRRTRRTCTA